MQANIQISIAVRPSALGELVVTLLKMLTSTRKRVTRRAMRPIICCAVFISKNALPGTMSGGIRKEIHETATNRPDGR